MKKRVNLAIIGLLAIIAPVVLTVVACGFKETKQESESVDWLVVEEINKIIYSKEVALASKADDLKNTITARFIVGKLPLEIKKIFENDLFILNKITDSKGEILTDDTFKFPGIVNAKINYDYGDFKNQNTNLIIDIQENRISLNDVFKDFYFTDDKGVEGFLDVNDLDLITEQIENFLGASLDQVGLTLGNRTSNSVLLKAKLNSREYVGELTLTWNLKLLEIYGMEHKFGENKWVNEGLKGYFYLETGTNQIKYFDVVGYLSDSTGWINLDYDRYHVITIKNQNDYSGILILGTYWTSQIARLVNGLDINFTRGIKVTAESPEINKVKVFNKKNNTWEGLAKETEYVFNSLGEMSKN